MYTTQFAKERFDQNYQWLKDNLIYECIMGSHAYACQNENSDYDIVGIVMPQKQHLFPQSYGFIQGFDTIPTFDNYECKGKQNRIKLDNKKEVEGVWHSITNFFHLVSNGSPNLTEILFVDRHLVTHGHKIAWMIRDNKRMFLSMKMYHSFRGFAYQQMTRVKKEVKRWREEHKCDNGSRTELYEKYGYDTKMCYHALRLLDLLHQLLTEGDLDLTRNKEESKMMRAGLWGNWEKFEPYFETKLAELEKLSMTSISVPDKPQTGALHTLLNNCIEEWYGSDSALSKQTEYVSAKEVMEKLTSIDAEIKEIKKNLTMPNA